MIGAELFGDDASVVGFVEIVFLETDGESLYRAGTGARHQGNDGGGIGAAAEKGAERHVGDQADFGGFEETLLQFFQTLFFVFGRMRVVFGKVPVLTDSDLAVLKLEQVSGRELMNSGEGRNGIGNVSVIKIFEQALGVDYGEFGSYGEDRFDFGSEVEISVVERIVKRLFAEAVAG